MGRILKSEAYYSLAEAAEKIGWHPKTLSKKVDQGAVSIPVQLVGGEGIKNPRKRFPKTLLDQWINNGCGYREINTREMMKGIR